MMIGVRPGVLHQCNVHKAGIVTADVMVMMYACSLSLGLHHAKAPSNPV